MEFQGEQIWNCPFCDKTTIKVIYFPATSRPKKTSWGGSKPWQVVTKEQYVVKSGCSNCGKSQKEVERALKEGKDDVEKEKKIFERLKAQGIIKDEMTIKF